MSRPATTKLKVNAPLGSLPVLQYCAPEQLLIDESYQRSLEVESSQALIRRIAMFWDWGLCQPLFVARRADGGLYVVDGQHRLAAAVLRGDIPQLPCVVSHFDDAAQEAAAFVTLNQQRRPLGAIDLFKAALAAGDPAAAEIKLCLDKAGLRLASHTNNQQMRAGQVANVGGMQRCQRTYGARVLEITLKIIARAYPQQVLRYAGSIFPGIAAVVAGELHNRADAVELLEQLSGFIGREPQHIWYKQFNQAVADDHLLKRAQAAERVIRRAWVDFKNSLAGFEEPKRTEPRPLIGESEISWCEQCDRRVSGSHVARCASLYCSLKANAA